MHLPAAVKECIDSLFRSNQEGIIIKKKHCKLHICCCIYPNMQLTMFVISEEVDLSKSKLQTFPVTAGIQLGICFSLQ